jgi:hypothetical protein
VPHLDCDHRPRSSGAAFVDEQGVPVPGWEDHATMYGGSLGFVGLNLFASLPRESFDASRPGSPSYDGTAVTVFLKAGASATVTVPSDAREHLLLLDAMATNPFPSGHPTLADGIASVSLTACPGADTVFLVAVIPDGPQCAPLDITTSDRVEPRRAYLPLGTGDTPCP